MLEYVFFDERLRDEFVTFVRDQGSVCEVRDDDDALIALVPEDIDDETGDRIDAHYDHLLGETAALFEDSLDKSVSGIQITLKNGTPCTIRLRPEIMNKALEGLTLDEFNELVETIASAVENPDSGPICKPPE